MISHKLYIYVFCLKIIFDQKSFPDIFGPIIFITKLFLLKYCFRAKPFTQIFFYQKIVLPKEYWYWHNFCDKFNYPCISISSQLTYIKDPILGLFVSKFFEPSFLRVPPFLVIPLSRKIPPSGSMNKFAKSLPFVGCKLWISYLIFIFMLIQFDWLLVINLFTVGSKVWCIVYIFKIFNPKRCPGGWII